VGALHGVDAHFDLVPRPSPAVPPQMFREYPNDVTLNGGGFVKQVGRNSFNGVSQRQKLRHPRGVFRTLHACQFVHRGVTDLTLDRFAVVQHRKSECQPRSRIGGPILRRHL